MSKKPYFITADGVAVKESGTVVFCVFKGKDGLYYNAVATLLYGKAMYTPDNIFSTRAAAQAECDKRNEQ